jgi:hypothetical protein
LISARSPSTAFYDAFDPSLRFIVMRIRYVTAGIRSDWRGAFEFNRRRQSGGDILSLPEAVVEVYKRRRERQTRDEATAHSTRCPQDP